MTARRAMTWTLAAVLAATTSACQAAEGSGNAAPAQSPVTAQPTQLGPGGEATPTAADTGSAKPAVDAPTQATGVTGRTEEPLQTATTTETEPTAAASTTAPATGTPSTGAAASPAASASAASRKPLKVGDSGPEVVALQKKLLERGFWLPGADGEFGAITQQAVFAAQKTFGLPRTGLAGPMTMKALDGGAIPATSTRSGKAVEISIKRQTLTLVDNGKVEAILNTSTGNGETFYSEGVKYIAVTPEGTYDVQSRNPNNWVKGPLGEMYKPVFFNGGIAFHGSAEIPPYPASHGCARLSRAAQDYIWSKGYAVVGGTVVVS